MIVNHLSRIMGERRLKVLTVSRATGIPRSSVAQFYAGRLQRYDASTLARLCGFLKVGVGDILEFVPEAE